MNIYVSDIVKLYRDTIICHLVNSGTSYLLFCIVQCWHVCEFDEDNRSLPMVLYWLGIMCKYYSCLGFFPIKHNKEWKYTHNEIFNKIPHFIKNRPRVNFLQDGFVMYNCTVLILKREVIHHIPDFIIPVYFCQKINPLLIFLLKTWHPILNCFLKKIGSLYLTEIMRTDWLQMLDE